MGCSKLSFLKLSVNGILSLQAYICLGMFQLIYQVGALQQSLVAILLSPSDNGEVLFCLNFTEFIVTPYCECCCIICILYIMYLQKSVNRYCYRFCRMCCVNVVKLC